jgi:hypothetical protein
VWTIYDEIIDNIYTLKITPPPALLNLADKKHNYKQLCFEIIDSIVGMFCERFQDMKQLRF